MYVRISKENSIVNEIVDNYKMNNLIDSSDELDSEQLYDVLSDYRQYDNNVESIMLKMIRDKENRELIDNLYKLRTVKNSESSIFNAVNNFLINRSRELESDTLDDLSDDDFKELKEYRDKYNSERRFVNIYAYILSLKDDKMSDSLKEQIVKLNYLTQIDEKIERIMSEFDNLLKEKEERSYMLAIVSNIFNENYKKFKF